MKFLLNCWVPSLSDYVKISELSMHQLEVMSKYLVNEDHLGTNACFNEIIQENLHDKKIYAQLNKLDKWFILSFLKCNNISPLIIIKAKNQKDEECTVDFNLVDILTKASEYSFKFNPVLEIKNFEAQFKLPNNLYSSNILVDTVKSIKLDSKIVAIPDLSEEICLKFFNTLDSSLAKLLYSYLNLQDASNDFYLLKNTKNFKNLYDIKLNIFDNNLFYFLRSIYLPYAKSLYAKKYNLISKIGLTVNDIDKLTPLEEIS